MLRFQLESRRARTAALSAHLDGEKRRCEHRQGKNDHAEFHPTPAVCVSFQRRNPGPRAILGSQRAKDCLKHTGKNNATLRS